MPSPVTPSRASTGLDSLVGYLIGPVFLAVAVWLIAAPPTKHLPTAERVKVERDAFSSAPRRETITDPPTMDVAGFAKQCMECHALFQSIPETPLRLNQHRNIVQAHGMNDRCFNCHDNEDRNKLVLPGGTTIPFADSAHLCATCHGTTYRDWQQGIHGRTTGSWDPSGGRQSRLTCTQCHDPHAPAFGGMQALPGPNTLRMGDPHAARDHPPAQRNPLRRWSRGEEPQ